MDFDLLAQELDSYNLSDILNACYKLAAIDNPKAVDLLVVATENEHFDARILALELLSNRKDARLIEHFELKLNDTEHEIRFGAVKILAQFGIAALTPLLAALDDEEPYIQQEAAEAIAKVGDPAVSPLLELLEGTDLHRRIGSAFSLQFIKSQRVIQPMLDILLNKNEDSELRGIAAYALAQFDEVNVINILIELLTDKNENDEVRTSLIKALARIGNNQIVEPLLKATVDESENVRAAAIRSFEHVKIPEVEKHLLSALNDSSDKVRATAIWILGIFQSKQAVKPLLNLIPEEKNKIILKRAIEALGEIKDPSIVEPLLKLMIDTADIDILKTITEALGKLDDQRVLDPLIQELLTRTSKGEVEVELWAISKAMKNYELLVTPILISIFKGENESWRKRAVFALGVIGNRSAIEPLLEALTEESAGISIEAAIALGEIGDERDIPILTEYMQSIISTSDSNNRLAGWIEWAIRSIRSRSLRKGYWQLGNQ